MKFADTIEQQPCAKSLVEFKHRLTSSPIMKPNIPTIWAATGNTTAPTLSQQTVGWNAGTPPNSYFFNYKFNQYDDFLEHINQQGICVWDSLTTYFMSSIAKGSNGALYQSQVDNNLNHDPTTDSGANWIGILDVISSYSNPRPNVLLGSSMSRNPFTRGNVFTGLAAGSATFVADRFRLDIGTTSNTICTAQQINFGFDQSLTGIISEDSLQVQATTGDPSPSGPDPGVKLVTIVSGYDMIELSNNYFVLAFPFLATVSGNYSVALRNNVQNNSGDWSYVTTIAVTANLEANHVLIIPPMPFTGNWDFRNGAGLILSVALCAPAAGFIAPSLNTWLVGNYVAASSQVNLFAAAAARFVIDLMKIEKGQIFTGYRSIGYNTEKQALEAYCQTTYRTGNYPGSVSPQDWLQFFQRSGGPSLEESIIFNTRMINDPTVTIYSGETGAAGFAYNYNVPGDVPVTVGSQGGLASFLYQITSGGNTGDTYSFNYLADAEYYTNGF